MGRFLLALILTAGPIWLAATLIVLGLLTSLTLILLTLCLLVFGLAAPILVPALSPPLSSLVSLPARTLLGTPIAVALIFLVLGLPPTRFLAAFSLVLLCRLRAPILRSAVLSGRYCNARK